MALLRRRKRVFQFALGTILFMSFAPFIVLVISRDQVLSPFASHVEGDEKISNVALVKRHEDKIRHKNQVSSCSKFALRLLCMWLISMLLFAGCGVWPNRFEREMGTPTCANTGRSLSFSLFFLLAVSPTESSTYKRTYKKPTTFNENIFHSGHLETTCIHKQL